MLTCAAIGLPITLGAALPAMAEESFACSSDTGPALSFQLKAIGLASVRNPTIVMGGKTWSTAEGEDQLSTGTWAYVTAEQIKFDVKTQYTMVLIAELRLFKTGEGGTTAYGGILRMPGEGIWAVSCTGP